MSNHRGDPVMAQPTDPPWARLLFMVLEGRNGQCWRAVLLLMPPLLLVVGLVLLTTTAPMWWISATVALGLLSASSLTLGRLRQWKHALRRVR